MKDRKIEIKDVVKGLETTLEELSPVLMDKVQDMSTKQLRRSLESVITFVSKAQDDRDVSSLGKKEQQFLGGLITLIETSRQYYLHIISEIEKDRLTKEASEKAEKGVENE